MDDLGQINPQYRRLLHDQHERLKELACINQTTAILKQGKTVEETLQEVVLILPAGWQYPEFTVARIKFMTKKFESAGFNETKWKNDSGIFYY